MAPQHCGLNLAARIQNLILDTWDCELELEAQNKAKQCDLDGLKVNDISGGLEEFRGENAFYFRTDSFDSSGGVLRGIERMGDEIHIAGIKNLKLGRYDKRIGHATQILWETTRKVGCSVQECSARNDGSLGGQNYNVAVCKYYPTGNIFKSSTPTSIYTIGDVGSSCSEGTFVDPTSGLCVEAM
uniref:SCP domain-containing protein n=1 Tax=Caenorhabditis tropicalis TaxID=1561998 RepID=A0A1I7TVR6_9PELO